MKKDGYIVFMLYLFVVLFYCKYGWEFCVNLFKCYISKSDLVMKK